MTDLTILDQYLLQVLNHLKSNWYQPDTGIVACALIDGSHVAFATSTRSGEYWVHAEQNAYQAYLQKFGAPSKEAIFVVTLSPCLNKLKCRPHESCVELMKAVGVHRVHFGVLDTMHAATLSEYTKAGLTSSVTRNPHLASMCQQLMNLFAEYDSRLNSELPQIKQQLGDAFFTALSFVNHYEISTDNALLDVEKIHSMLKDYFWSVGIPLALVKKFVNHSLCFGIYAKDTKQLVGFGRVITDYTTHAYVTDVVIDPEHRRRGLGLALMRTIMAHPDLQGLKTWSLRTTEEARPIYTKLGFVIAADHETQLEIEDLNIYLNQQPVRSISESM